MLNTVFDDEAHAAVEETWRIYQDLVAAYREKKERGLGKLAMVRIIDKLSTQMPKELPELQKLGRTLKRSAADILAYFEHPGSSKGPTGAINGRLEHLRGSALGFRNPTHYIARSLLETGGFRPHLRPQL